MGTNKVEICGIDTSNLKTLSEEEKRRLLRLSGEGDSDARCALVMGNLRLVLSVVGRFNPKHDGADDLFQVGCIGLIKAIDNFNLEMDVRFSTYAVPMICGCRNCNSAAFRYLIIIAL
jgi:RNA polymerase sporulation-specific sigma factor